MLGWGVWKVGKLKVSFHPWRITVTWNSTISLSYFCISWSFVNDSVIKVDIIDQASPSSLLSSDTVKKNYGRCGYRVDYYRWRYSAHCLRHDTIVPQNNRYYCPLISMLYRPIGGFNASTTVPLRKGIEGVHRIPRTIINVISWCFTKPGFSLDILEKLSQKWARIIF